MLDIGCGAGMDALLAAGQASEGRVIGVDMVGEMLGRARRAAEAGGVQNVEFRPGRADGLPVPNGSADLALTNGVLNLCVDKTRVVAEIHRVLRPGGACRWPISCWSRT